VDGAVGPDLLGSGDLAVATPDARGTGDAAPPAVDTNAPPPDATMPPPDLMPDVAPVTCPSGRGPSMVDVGGFCIDSTEVSNRQYKAFLADTSVTLQKQPSICIGKNVDFKPDDSDGGGVDVASRIDHPVVNVDWCDAAAFCLWAGKRLCGKIGGGSLGPGEGVFPVTSQWAHACTKGGTRAYPYGTTVKTTACQLGKGEPLPIKTLAVQSKPECMGGFDGLYHMVGNAEEWVDLCRVTDEGLVCGIIGAAYLDDTTAKCDQFYEDPIMDRWRARSFRCCSP
jgi:formylglycine-generating enzyme required for sulfatase activity